MMTHLYSIKTRKTFVGYEKPSLDDFYHHGILGMKWGKRNGPPYPLGAGDHSASEKKAGYKKSIGGGRNEELYDRKKKPSATIQTAKKTKIGSDNLSKKDLENHRKKMIQELKDKGMPSRDLEDFANSLSDDAVRADFKYRNDPDFKNKADKAMSKAERSGRDPEGEAHYKQDKKELAAEEKYKRTIKEFGDYDDEDRALDALAKKYGFKNRDELDSHYLTKTDRQEAKKDPKAYKEYKKDQEMSDAYDDISDFYYNKRNKADNSSKSNPLMNKAADLFVKRVLGFGSLEKYDSDKKEISDYRQKTQDSWRKNGYSEDQIKKYTKSLLSDDQVRESIRYEKRANANKELYDAWDKAENARDEYINKPKPEIMKKARELAIKDGVDPKDKYFDYFVNGDTPSENYYMIALEQDPTYKKLNKAVEVAYEKVKKADEEWEVKNK